MVGSSVLSWLRRRDENYLVIRRATRVTLIACLVFYGCRYGLGDATLATYALFGTIALGALSQVPGPPSARAGTLLLALPAVWALVTAGTLVAGSTWLAVAGMLVLGFAVSFSGVGGPRLVGLANGLQLFYILPCFPPYAPDTLLARLSGAALGVVLLAAAEVVLWPDPAPVRYPQRLGAAVERLAGFLDGLANAFAGTAAGRLEAAWAALDAAAEAVRPARLPIAVRPASASRRDRALRQAGAALRYATQQAHRLLLAARAGCVDRGIAALLRTVADTARSAGRTVTGGASPVGIDAIDRAVAAFDTGRVARHATHLGHDTRLARMRASAVALGAAEGVRSLAGAARVAAGRGAPPEPRPGDELGPFWYAHAATPVLWWRQFRLHLTPRSVYFQQALRVAAALAAARLVAGTFDLAHGFWVLLATLTLMRTSAADTRTTLRPALVGTLAGAAAAAVVTGALHDPLVYQAALPVTMLLGYALGPLLGVAWTQGLFTLVVTLVFAQLSPPTVQLAEARIENVLIGGAVGVLIGLLAWPSGGAGALRRAVATCFDTGTCAAEETVAALAGTDSTGDAARRARRALLLAEASYTQYQSERPDPRMARLDWHAALVTAHEMVRGGDALLRRYPLGSLAACAGVAARLAAFAGRLRAAFLALGDELRAGRLDSPVRPPDPPDDVLDRLAAAGDDELVGPRAQHLVDVEVWLAGLTGELTRIQSPPAPDG
ncbi:FUSC family protein [Gandjariella thermophila]|uniref:FUSC family protein n=1 Tax=Gandjariella thermophila TaxID=1931992 RepID=UPI0010F982D5|nr:FUSC family protein [Gandjariella thermophila]